MIYNRQKQYKETSESIRGHHRHLVRPDGNPMSTQDCCIFDLLKQWTKEGKVATSTYEWLLREKFPHKKDKKTIRRSFWNISLYFKVKFKQKQIIDGDIHYNKLRIERVADFDIKTTVAEQKEIARKWSHLEPKMVTPRTKNGHSSPLSTTEATKAPEPPIKITIKNTINNKINNLDNLSSNSIEKSVETAEFKNANSEYVETSNNGLAKEEFVQSTQDKISAKEDVAAYTPKQQNTPLANQTPSNSEQDVGDYYPMLLKNFPLTDRIIEEVLCKSNKPNYTIGKVRLIVRNILETTPNKPVYGGKTGLVKYLVQAVNNHIEYDNSDYTTNIFQKKHLTAEEQRIVDESWTSGKIKWFPC